MARLEKNASDQSPQVRHHRTWILLRQPLLRYHDQRRIRHLRILQRTRLRAPKLPESTLAETTRHSSRSRPGSLPDRLPTLRRMARSMAKRIPQNQRQICHHPARSHHPDGKAPLDFLQVIAALKENGLYAEIVHGLLVGDQAISDAVVPANRASIRHFTQKSISPDLKKTFHSSVTAPSSSARSWPSAMRLSPCGRLNRPGVELQAVRSLWPRHPRSPHPSANP